MTDIQKAMVRALLERQGRKIVTIYRDGRGEYHVISKKNGKIDKSHTIEFTVSSVGIRPDPHN